MAGIAQGRLDFSLILQGVFHYSTKLFHHQKLFFHYGLLAILLAIFSHRFQRVLTQDGRFPTIGVCLAEFVSHSVSHRSGLTMRQAN